ncbi:Conserved protein of uncharacterised function%2C possible antitoxin [Mycobacterium tuberculosis]|uniref:Conserved protein of uncharacterized function, possible antitoxin n=1 Tax=Mycobacterium tuberculosis TaxID=1773 RepID=A0A654T9W2_MYCTX|nr:Conserved protein of uncharacterised function%2C possible antitoxin [Mycobacterium tuberculosis]
MSEVASRELRNDTAGVLRRVRAGEDVTITVSGRSSAAPALAEQNGVPVAVARRSSRSRAP